MDQFAFETTPPMEDENGTVVQRALCPVCGEDGITIIRVQVERNTDFVHIQSRVFPMVENKQNSPRVQEGNGIRIRMGCCAGHTWTMVLEPDDDFINIRNEDVAESEIDGRFVSLWRS